MYENNVRSVESFKALKVKKKVIILPIQNAYVRERGKPGKLFLKNGLKPADTVCRGAV